LLNVYIDTPDVFESPPNLEDPPASHEVVAEAPVLPKGKEKPRSTPTEPMTNEAWIQWMDDEVAGLHGKPMFELRPSKIDHPRAGLGVFTTESCGTIHPGFKIFMAGRVLRVDKEDPIAQQVKHPSLVALRGPQYNGYLFAGATRYIKRRHRGRIASFFNTCLSKKSLLKMRPDATYQNMYENHFRIVEARDPERVHIVCTKAVHGPDVELFLSYGPAYHPIERARVRSSSL